MIIDDYLLLISMMVIKHFDDGYQLLTYNHYCILSLEDDGLSLSRTNRWLSLYDGSPWSSNHDPVPTEPR